MPIGDPLTVILVLGILHNAGKGRYFRLRLGRGLEPCDDTGGGVQ